MPLGKTSVLCRNLVSWCVGLGFLSLGGNPLRAAEPSLLTAFNGHDLTGFYVYLGPDQDVAGQKLFTVTPEGWLRIAGDRQGYLSTKESWQNYRLRAEFKWGQPVVGKQDNASDSGIFFHAPAEDKLWANAFEVQMRDGATADLCLIGKGPALTVRGKRFDHDCVPRPGKGDPKAEIENPRGEWNAIDLECRGDQVTLRVNDKLVLEGTQAEPHAGRIYFQSYQGELFYRKIQFEKLAP